MKFRFGFVANSSASSFIIEVFMGVVSCSIKKKKSITAEQEKKLVKFGFKPTPIFCPNQIDELEDNCYFNNSKKINDAKEIKKKHGYYNYGYAVSCNQDDVIEFLLKNRIPFIASIHYQHYTMFYSGGDFFYKIPNLGNMIRPSGRENIKKAFMEAIANEQLFDEQMVDVYLNRWSNLSPAKLIKKVVKIHPKNKRKKIPFEKTLNVPVFMSHKKWIR